MSNERLRCPTRSPTHLPGSNLSNKNPSDAINAIRLAIFFVTVLTPLTPSVAATVVASRAITTALHGLRMLTERLVENEVFRVWW